MRKHPIKRRRRRRLPPCQRQRQRTMGPVPALVLAQLRMLGRRVGRQLRAFDEHLVLALDPCARVCCCSDPGRHLRRARFLPKVPRLPSGWALLDRCGIQLGVLDRRPRWQHPEQLRAVRSVLLLVLLLSMEIVTAAILSSYADAHRDQLAQERLQ